MADSERYQDYVISEGRFIGRFEDMYRNSSEIPWHQDEMAKATFSDHTVAILKRRQPQSLLDVGCGLGYMADRLRCEVPTLARVVGLDISETAIRKAGEMFPQIEFIAGKTDAVNEQFDVVVSKDVIWYVLDDVLGYISELRRLSKCLVYIGQSFPVARPFYGEHIFPEAAALLRFLSEQGKILYSLVERDAAYGDREYAHALVEISPK